MRTIAVALALLVIACKPGSVTTPEHGDAKAIAAENEELKAVADRIDPGPQAPMFEALPPWLKGKVDAMLTDAPTGSAVIAEAREAVAAWDKQRLEDPQAMLRAGLQLGRGVVLAERAVAAGSADPELLAVLTKAYRVIELFKLFETNQMFATVLGLARELASKEGGLEARELDEAIGALKVVVSRAEALHLHTAARMLREHPRHPTISDVLIRLAQAEGAAERYPESIALRKLAVKHKAGRATGADWLTLADACYRALDVACGDEARTTGVTRGPEEPSDAKKREAFDKQVASTDELGRQARRVSELAAQPGLAEQNERGHLLITLGRRAEAEAVFAGMKEKHPGDARPLTGLAVAALHRDGNFLKAAALLRGARGLAGRDRLYYEAALGTVPVAAMSEVLKEVAQTKGDQLPASFGPLIEELMELTRGYAEFDPARAAVLELVIGAARVAAPKFMAGDRAGGLALVRKLPGQVRALVEKFPESKDAWKLLYTASRIVTDGVEAKLLVTAPLPASLQKDPDVRLQQVRAQIDLGVMFEDMSLLEAAVRSAETLPEGGDATAALWVRATLDALVGRSGDKQAYQRGFDGFAALIDKTSGADRALALNNAGYLQAMAGVADAAQTFDAANAIDDGVWAAGLNVGALAYSKEPTEAQVTLFREVAGSKVGAIRVLAHAWLVALADAGFADVKVTRKEFADTLKSELAGEFRGGTLTGRFGVAVSGDFKLSFGYTSNAGLVLIDEVVSRWWLVGVPPNYDALVAGDPKPGAAKPAKPGAAKPEAAKPEAKGRKAK